MSNIHIIEKNFDSDFRGDYKGYHIDNRLTPKPQTFSPIYNKIISYQIIKIINTSIIALETFDTIIYLNEQIQKIYIRHSHKGLIRNLCEINNEKENIIHIMKRMIDDFIMILCAYYDSNNILKNHKLEIDSIGDLKKHDTVLSTNIKKDLKYAKYKPLFDVINDLHNAYKHSCLMKEAHLEYAPEGVSLTAYYAKDNKIDSIEYHNHNFMHIIIGFSDFLLEFCGVEVYNRKCKIITSKRKVEI